MSRTRSVHHKPRERLDCRVSIDVDDRSVGAHGRPPRCFLPPHRASRPPRPRPAAIREGRPREDLARDRGRDPRAKASVLRAVPGALGRPATTRRAVPDAAQALAVAEMPPRCARRGDASAVPAVGDLAEGSFLSPALPLLAILGGLGIYKAAVYWRVQFITASMIGRHVPPGARRVLEYGVGQGKNLYYYPKSVGMVVGIDPDAKEDLLIQVSVASGVPFVAKKQPLESGSGQADASIDAVVSTGSFGKVRDPEALLREAARVLKPGAPLVFVEDLGTLTEKGDVLGAPPRRRRRRRCSSRGSTTTCGRRSVGAHRDRGGAERGISISSRAAARPRRRRTTSRPPRGRPQARKRKRGAKVTRSS